MQQGETRGRGREQEGEAEQQKSPSLCPVSSDTDWQYNGEPGPKETLPTPSVR